MLQRISFTALRFTAIKGRAQIMENFPHSLCLPIPQRLKRHGLPHYILHPLAGTQDRRGYTQHTMTVRVRGKKEKKIEKKTKRAG